MLLAGILEESIVADTSRSKAGTHYGGNKETIRFFGFKGIPTFMGY